MKTITIQATYDFYATIDTEVEVDDDFNVDDEEALHALANENELYNKVSEPEINDIWSISAELVKDTTIDELWNEAIAA